MFFTFFYQSVSLFQTVLQTHVERYNRMLICCLPACHTCVCAVFFRIFERKEKGMVKRL